MPFSKLVPSKSKVFAGKHILSGGRRGFNWARCPVPVDPRRIDAVRLGHLDDRVLRWPLADTGPYCRELRALFQAEVADETRHKEEIERVLAGWDQR
jgi:hypothetical protein